MQERLLRANEIQSAAWTKLGNIAKPEVSPDRPAWGGQVGGRVWADPTAFSAEGISRGLGLSGLFHAGSEGCSLHGCPEHSYFAVCSSWLVNASFRNIGFLYQGQDQNVVVQARAGGSPARDCRKCLLHKLHGVAEWRAEMPCPG